MKTPHYLAVGIIYRLEQHGLNILLPPITHDHHFTMPDNLKLWLIEQIEKNIEHAYWEGRSDGEKNATQSYQTNQLED